MVKSHIEHNSIEIRLTRWGNRDSFSHLPIWWLLRAHVVWSHVAVDFSSIPRRAYIINASWYFHHTDLSLVTPSAWLEFFISPLSLNVWENSHLTSLGCMIMGRNHTRSHLLKCKPHISPTDVTNKFWCFPSSSCASIEGLYTLPYVSKNTISHLRPLPKRRRQLLVWVSQPKPGDIPITSRYVVLWCTCVYMQLTRIINACQILLMFQTSCQKYNILQKQI